LTSNGCLRVIPGSHTDKILHPHLHEDKVELVLNQAVNEDCFDPNDAVDLELQPGQMSLHDVYMIHGAKANTSNIRRTGVAIRYMPTTSHFDRSLHPAKGTSGLPLNFATRPLWLLKGRDVCGQLWLDDLTHSPQELAPVQAEPSTAQINPAPAPTHRLHHSHKGTYGDLAVVGGEGLNQSGMGMTGAALLAAQAALHGGAGRVMVHLLGEELHTTDLSLLQPAWMQRSFKALELEQLTVVCGCGGGMAVSRVLAEVLQRSHQLVLDADALNALARDPVLARLLQLRSAGHRPTVLTPHPLEAARLLGCGKEQVQAHRLESAAQLAAHWGCTVVLKGSGTVIAAPGQTSRINPTGNGQLATAGSGDVLAGLIGAKLAQGQSEFEAARQAVYTHGEIADLWPAEERLTAWALASRCL
jgi:hydroxyethylthiazole kinase-like uncharacterized protein yjeF